MIYCLSSECTYYNILPHITMSRVLISFPIFKYSSRIQLAISFNQFVMCFQKFCIYVFIETQPLKQHINTLGTRREIRILAYSSFCKDTRDIRNQWRYKIMLATFQWYVYIVDRINCLRFSEADRFPTLIQTIKHIKKIFFMIYTFK